MPLWSGQDSVRTSDCLGGAAAFLVDLPAAGVVEAGPALVADGVSGAVRLARGPSRSAKERRPREGTASLLAGSAQSDVDRGTAVRVRHRSDAMMGRCSVEEEEARTREKKERRTGRSDFFGRGGNADAYESIDAAA